MRKLTTMTILAAAAALAACNAPRQVDETPPTVTFSFDSRRDYDEIVRRADRHCRERYGLRAYEIDNTRVGRGYEATFACE